MDNQPRRLTKEMQQEDISRCQFKEWLAKFGWQVIEPQRDLGEDMLIHVYFDGRATGTVFHIQLKSVTNLEQRKKKRSNSLSYSFEVKDLKHWFTFDQPVILVIWDTILREGRWILIDDAISTLDDTNPTWRDKKKVSISIAWKNDTSNSGFEKLRMEIGTYFYPLISRDKELKMKLRMSFISTNEGMRVKEEFQKFIREGEPLILNNEFHGGVDFGVDFSEWWSKWFLPTGARFCKIGLIPKGNKEIIANKIAFLGKNGRSVIFENVIFRASRVGTDLLILSNEYQPYPVNFQIEYRKTEDIWAGRLQQNFRLLGHSVTDTKKIVDFWEILVSGGKTIIEFSNSKDELNSTEFNNFPSQLSLTSPYFVEFVDKLYEIQNRTGCLINIPLDISDWAIVFTNQLFEIISTGKIYMNFSEMRVDYDRSSKKSLVGYSDKEGFIEIIEFFDDSSAEIFETVIPLGKRKDIIRGKPTLDREEFLNRISKLKEEESIEIVLYEVILIKEFDDWMQN